MKLLKRLWKSIVAIFNKADDFLEAHVTQALRLTSALKKLLDSPVADIVEALIPGDIDKLIREKLLLALDASVKALGIIDTCKGLNDADKLRCIVAELQKLPKDGRDAVLFKMAALLVKYMHGSKMSQHMYDLITQARYYQIRQAKK